MSTLKTTNIAHPSSASNNIVLDANGNVNIDSNTLYVDATNNRVGINTTSPGYPLDIQSEAGGAGLRIRGGSGGSSVLQFTDNAISSQWGAITTSSTSCNIEHSSIVRFTTASTERVRLDSSGRLLVGTSTGSEKLRVAGQIQIGNGTSGGGGGGFVRTTQSTATGSSHTIAYTDYGPNGGGDDFSGFMVITAQFTGYPGKTAVGTFAVGKNTAAGVSVTQLSNTKIGMTTFTVGTSGNDITVTTDSSCKVSCVFMGGQ